MPHIALCLAVSWWTIQPGICITDVKTLSVALKGYISMLPS